MILISVNILERYLEKLEDLVHAGYYPNRAEAIRVAIRDFIKGEFYREKEEEITKLKKEYGLVY